VVAGEADGLAGGTVEATTPVDVAGQLGALACCRGSDSGETGRDDGVEVSLPGSASRKPDDDDDATGARSLGAPRRGSREDEEGEPEGRRSWSWWRRGWLWSSESLK